MHTVCIHDVAIRYARAVHATVLSVYCHVNGVAMLARVAILAVAAVAVFGLTQISTIAVKGVVALVDGIAVVAILVVNACVAVGNTVSGEDLV